MFASSGYPVLAQSTAEPDRARLDERFDRIDWMLESVGRLPERDRDGLLFRIDEEILALAGELNTMADRLPSREPDTEPTTGLEANRWLRERLDLAFALSIERIEKLSSRMDAELAEHDEFSESTETIISRTFVQDLRQVRLNHMTAIIDQFDNRSALGLPEPAGQRARLENNLDLATARLVGQIRLDSMTLEELRSRIAADPTDESLRSALRVVERKQTGNLDTIARVIALLSRLGRDTTELRALQARQRGLIGAEILDSGVFTSLLNDRINMLKEKFFLSGPVWLLRTLAFLAVLGVAWLIARGARALVRRITLHQSVELGDLRERTLVSLTYSVILLVGFVLALSALGVSLLPLLAGLGVASIIVGLALQESLGNLAAGGMILATRPFDLHDQIRVGNAEGKVKDMSLVATTIASQDNKMLVIPNRQVWSSAITNYSRAEIRRVDIEVSVPYGVDLVRVERELRDCIEAEERVLDEPSPIIHFGDIGETSVSFWIRAWVRTADTNPVTIALKRSVAERLRNSGVDSGLQTS